ncbi:putative hydrolase of the HAD superfamily [Asanoa ferruginea]|uniref:Putative hydrolase of the HAD superfamily n=1 Tax=Asanoa ferruginea TaxID=53367 RepID=A0A3D9ZXC2_9ACTN|nr:HAD-IA family hydrolase [Asanoa ferruginea]REG01816.1 putative hydrolase of the HAD superfamily [Asanoa ferruginea]GIF50306.1 haloacid dehalogenase [Asanoa ferruginea]
MTPFAAVVFDFDGLLMDTETTLVEAWRAEWAFHGLSLDLTDTFWPGHGGDITQHRLDRLGALVGPGFDRAASHARFLAHRERLHRTLALRPGIAAWLTEARAAGLTCAVASSSPLTWVQGHLSRAGVFDTFKAVATGDEVAAHKPDPAIYRLVLDRLGLPPASAVAIEDTPHGIAAARAAGIPAVAIPNPFVKAADCAGASLVLSTAADLPLSEMLACLARTASAPPAQPR